MASKVLGVWHGGLLQVDIAGRGRKDLPPVSSHPVVYDRDNGLQTLFEFGKVDQPLIECRKGKLSVDVQLFSGWIGHGAANPSDEGP